MLSVKSETSTLQKCKVQARRGHFLICTQQTPPTSVTSNCVPVSDDRMVQHSQFFQPNLAPAGACTPCFQKSVGLLAGQGTIQWRDTHHVS